MLRKIVITSAIIFTVSLTVLFLWLSSRKKYSGPHSQQSVYINYANGKYSLIRNGHPFTIKGASGFTHLDMLSRYGGNTIRTYDTSGLEQIMLDAEKYNIAVIIGIDLPKSGATSFFYADSNWRNRELATIQATVNRYKKSPALLMWCVGNELYFPLRPKFNPFYNFFNQVVDMIHNIDGNHPVTTAMINFDIRNILTIKHRTNVDIISFNIFHGKVKELKKELDGYEWLWKDPYFIAEWGTDGPWSDPFTTAWMAPFEPTSNQKAKVLIDTHNKYFSDTSRMLGDMVFYWGFKQEGTHTWFSFLNESGQPSLMSKAMMHIWKKTPDDSMHPVINGMFLNDSAFYSSPILLPNENVQGRVATDGKSDYKYRWNIYPEDWYQKEQIKLNETPLQPIGGLITKDSGAEITFTAPAQEGPYRLFVDVYDSHGGYSSANMPFYVLSTTKK